MNEIKNKIENPIIKLKEDLQQSDYDDINSLKELCLKDDKTSLKLEIDYKLNKIKENREGINNINEFMFYNENSLIGYIGVNQFGGGTLEINGMVHPKYRRKGVFEKLFSLVKDEWHKRNSQSMLLLSDANSIAGIEFIKKICGNYDHSEYEMYLRKDVKHISKLNTITLRKATKEDGKEIAWQNSIYFGIEYDGEEFSLPEEYDSVIYIAEVNNIVIGKVHFEVNDGVGGIYGLGVLPEYRRKGYGREILIMAIERLKEKNPNEIMLQVDVQNKNALELYKYCGFEETSTMEYYKLSKINI